MSSELEKHIEKKGNFIKSTPLNHHRMLLWSDDKVQLYRDFTSNEFLYRSIWILIK
jgi:hypothetical protein